MKLNVEKGHHTPVDMVTVKCSFCGKIRFCEILMNSKGKKINLCERCRFSKQ